MNDLYRLVTEQEGSTHVGSVVLTEEEAREALACEATLHLMTGWLVAFQPCENVKEAIVVVTRGDLARVLSVVQVNESEAIHERL